jgi:hypothetical protein
MVGSSKELASHQDRGERAKDSLLEKDLTRMNCEEKWLAA